MKNNAIEETARNALSATIKPSKEGPIIMPAKISPTTDGRENLSKSSPIRSAAANTINTSVMILNGSKPIYVFFNKQVFLVYFSFFLVNATKLR